MSGLLLMKVELWDACFTYAAFLLCTGAELAFQRVEGVISTCVGYTQGKLVNPTYQQVVSDTTGHAEAVAADYDPSKVSYEELVQLFWNRLGKSALTLNQVGNDVRTF